jgi:CRP-like cAMP-binding protein
MVYVTSPEGEDMVLARLGSGETFGELALVDGGARTASARALSSVSLVAIPRDAFAAMLRDHPDLTEALLRSLGALLRRILEQASDLVFLDLQGRVAKLLVGLADRHGCEVEGGIQLDLGMSQSNLAGMVGGSRPTVNQILKSFEAKGYVQLTGRQILVKAPDRLRRRAGL